MAKTKEREQSFEASLSSLERIVTQLESGDLPLERALELFEDGVGMARRCQTQLEDAERKVEMLLRERGEIKVVSFESPKDNQPDEADRSNSVLSNTGGLNAAATNSEADENDKYLDDAIPF